MPRTRKDKPRKDKDKLRRKARYRERKDAPRAALELFHVPAHVRRKLAAMCPGPVTPEECDGEAEGVELWKAERAAPGQREARRREYREKLAAWREKHGHDATPSERYWIARRIVERGRIRSRAERFAAETIAEIAWARARLTQEDAARDAQALRNELTKLETMLARTARTLDEHPEGARLTVRQAEPIIKAAAYLRTSDSADALLMHTLATRCKGPVRALLVDAVREIQAKHDAATARGEPPEIWSAGTAGLSLDGDLLLRDAGADALACGDALADYIKQPAPSARAHALALVAALRDALPHARVGGRFPAPRLRHWTAVELAVRVLRIAREYGMRELPVWYHDSTKTGEGVSGPVELVALAGECADPADEGRRRPLRGWVEITTEALEVEAEEAAEEAAKQTTGK